MKKLFFKLPPFIPHLYGKGKRAAISKLACISQKRIRFYIVLALKLSQQSLEVKNKNTISYDSDSTVYLRFTNSFWKVVQSNFFLSMIRIFQIQCPYWHPTVLTTCSMVKQNAPFSALLEIMVLDKGNSSFRDEANSYVPYGEKDRRKISGSCECFDECI